MGLDFYVFKLKKGYSDTVRNVINRMNYTEFEACVLAYGRKSWELVHELECDTYRDCLTELTLDSWINLQDKLAPIGPSLERIRLAYYADDNGNTTPEDKWFMNQYMKWYDYNFDTNPQLGYGFSVGYMQDFWEKADEVLHYLEDPDWEVWMIASY